MTQADFPQIAALALGRILRMGARPSQPGDAAEYERCRTIILNALDPQSSAHWDFQPIKTDTSINYARDRSRGAQGD